IFPRVGQAALLPGFRPLPRKLTIDWSHFFALAPDPVRPQHAMRIDTAISPGLFALPPLDLVHAGHAHRALPWLDLLRGRALGLPSGQDVAPALGEPPLTPDDLPDPTPLWLYVLCEAAAYERGRPLGPVGATIVAGVLLGLLEADPTAYPPGWTPELSANGDFTMADLARFTH